MNFNDVRIYSIDLELTKNCNFRCRYCFEDFEGGMFKETDKFISRMRQLLDSNFFKSKYDLLNIGFWGGEPTLNPDVIRQVVDEFAENNRVKFFIYTNGYNLTSIIDRLMKFKSTVLLGGHPKFCIQISYDGRPIHDIYRFREDGALTSTSVRKNIEQLNELSIPNVLKSTIAPDVFRYMSDAYLDIYSIFDKYRDKPFFKGHNYLPTIEYYKVNSLAKTDVDRYCKELEESLIKIAPYEIEHYKKYGEFLFSWFNNSKALCAAGKHIVAIDCFGKVFVCHGCFYSEDKQNHFLTELGDDNFVDKLERSWVNQRLNTNGPN